MPTFVYTSPGSGGTATIEAPDRGTALRELMRRGVTPTSIGSIDEGGAASSGESASGSVTRARGSASLSRAELAMLIRELATALSAGLPMVQALRTIAKQGRNPRQKAMLDGLIESIEQGKSLGDAAAAEPKAFSELTVNLIRAGEASGKLEVVLAQAAELLDRDVKIRRSVLAATMYPMILAGLITVAVVIIVTVIVPRTLKAVQGRITELPFPTQVVQGVAWFFGNYWWAVIPVALGVVYTAGALYRRPDIRLAVDRGLLKVPLLGRVLRDVAVARFTRTLGTLVSAGIPAVQALRITKGTLGNRAMEGVIDEVCEQVTSGRTIAEPMERSGYFPPMLVQIINLGERSGRLDQLLNQAAGAFEDRTETSVKLFMTALPPVLVVGLACVVGFVVLAILLPLLQMQESLG
ncbi:MAG: type II secretion system F family protein [Phycisphaeraceae bacterium]|nr:MAG: type II secretion system F family protein [Phycisphaeraceae bacterium]